MVKALIPSDLTTLNDLEWVNALFRALDPQVHPEAIEAFQRWKSSDEEWAAAEGALRDLINTQGFIASAQTVQGFPGIAEATAEALVQAAFSAQWMEVLREWEFLRHISSPVMPSKRLTREFDLRTMFQGLDRWGEKMTNKLQRIRENPFWLIQLDKSTLQELMPTVQDPRELRMHWMTFLRKAWHKAPDRDELQFRTHLRWAAVLATLLDAQDHGHTYVSLRHKTRQDWVTNTLNTIRHYSEEPHAADDAVREWVREVAKISARDDSPIMRTYGVRLTPASNAQYETVQWQWLFRGEYELSEQFIRRMQRPAYPWPSAGDAILAQGYTDDHGNHYALDPMQQEAIRFLYTAPFGILAAPPGVGKTTVIGMLHRIALQDPEISPESFIVATPTGRSARVASEHIDVLSGPLATPVATAHSWVSTANAIAQRNQQSLDGVMASLLGEGFLVVDEAFATDAGILGALTYRFGGRGRLLLIGDPDQLLPMSGGAPAFDLLQAVEQGLANRQIPFNPMRTLNIVHRSVPEIITNAQALWHDPLVDSATGKIITDPQTQEPVYAQHQWNPHTFPRLNFSNPEALVEDLISTICDWEAEAKANQQSSVVAWHVMTWRTIEARWLNEQIRTRLFPETTTSLMPFVVGERIVQNHNDYQVGLRNGEFGIVTAVSAKGQAITADFGHGKLVTLSLMYVRKRWQPAYVTTVAKAQGGEWHKVAFVHLPKPWVHEQIKATMPKEYLSDEESANQEIKDSQLNDRRVLYVAWTRGKTLVRFYAMEPESLIERLTRSLDAPRRSKGKRRTRLMNFVRSRLNDGALPPASGSGGSITI